MLRNNINIIRKIKTNVNSTTTTKHKKNLQRRLFAKLPCLVNHIYLKEIHFSVFCVLFSKSAKFILFLPFYSYKNFAKMIY